MGCLKLSILENQGASCELTKYTDKKELTSNFSKNKEQSAYFYGYQGQEHDNELKGKGNSYNFKYRMDDPRVGRFFAVDPLAKKYPFWSPYSFSGNQVIASREIEGLEPSDDKNNYEVGEVGQGTDKSSEDVKTVYNWALEIGGAWKKLTKYTGANVNEAYQMSKDVYTINGETNSGHKAGDSKYKLAIPIYVSTMGMDYKAAIYSRTIDGNTFYAMAFAGTDDLMDAGDDVNQLAGGISVSYMATALLINKLSKSNIRMTYTGHSLGGGQAALASRLTGGNAITFNAAALNRNTLNRWGAHNHTGKIDNYYIRGEAVHFYQRYLFGMIPEGTQHPLSMENVHLNSTNSIFNIQIQLHKLKSIGEALGIE